jgi:3D (Asp-Asp-Asp) domain-containing protein
VSTHSDHVGDAIVAALAAIPRTEDLKNPSKSTWIIWRAIASALDLQYEWQWIRIQVDPMATSLPGERETIAWQEDPSTGLPVAIWVKNGDADGQWSMLWPSTYAANDVYVNVFEEDFTHATGGGLVAGSNIHNGRLWHFENDGAASACNWNPSGQGFTLTVDPTRTLITFGTVRDGPIVTMGLQDLLPHSAELDELWLWGIVQDLPLAGYNNGTRCGTIFGLEARSSAITTRYVAWFRHVHTSPTVNQPWLQVSQNENGSEITTYAANESTEPESLGRQTTDDVVVLRYRGPKHVDVYSGVSVAGAFPERDTLAYVHTLVSVVPGSLVNTGFVGGFPAVFFGCGSDNATQTGVLQRLRVEYTKKSGGGGGTSTVTTTDEALYTVPIVDNGVATFYAHRNLFVTGGGTFDGIDTTGCIRGTRLTLTFESDTIVAAMGTPTVGVKIKTPRMGDDNPQDVHLLADDVMVLQLSPDGTFWKVVTYMQ